MYIYFPQSDNQVARDGGIENSSHTHPIAIYSGDYMFYTLNLPPKEKEELRLRAHPTSQKIFIVGLK